METPPPLTPAVVLSPGESLSCQGSVHALARGNQGKGVLRHTAVGRSHPAAQPSGRGCWHRTNLSHRRRREDPADAPEGVPVRVRFSHPNRRLRRGRPATSSPWAASLPADHAERFRSVLWLGAASSVTGWGVGGARTVPGSHGHPPGRRARLHAPQAGVAGGEEALPRPRGQPARPPRPPGASPDRHPAEPARARTTRRKWPRASTGSESRKWVPDVAPDAT